MAQRKFRLRANVSSDNLAVIKAALERIIANKGTIRQTDQGFEVEADLEGESARVLNRMILSELRRAEKRTRIRAEWTSGDATERFFDYVPKGTRNTQGK
ncbi:MAG: hypothetical protein ABSB38_02255 [Dehalococcoidia bacterium]